MTSLDRPDRDRGLAAVPDPATLSDDDGGAPAEAPRGAMALAPAAGRRWRGPLAAVTVVLAVLVVPIAIAVGLTLTSGPGGPSTARVVTAQELQDEYGIKVDLVAVIAAGGLVDVRFTVLDKEKAGHLLHDTTALPELYLETSGAVLRTSQPKAHKMTVLDGASYFLLYPNSGGLIRAGTQVSIVIDSVRLAPVGAQS